jgi:hypothetical protein
MAKKGMPWDKAILKVLQEYKQALKYTEITDFIIQDQLRGADEIGATPANTVNAYLHGDKLKDKVAALGRGMYILKDYLDQDPSLATIPSTQQEDEDSPSVMEDSLITAYGRFWDRDLWLKNKYALYGTSTLTKNAACVDFSKHYGLYLLHKGYQVIYVGQAAKQSLSVRLANHHVDHLRNRWDSFSWFSLKDIEGTQDVGANATRSLNVLKIIDTLEALLIETLGPERNKKDGNGFGGKEFEQITEFEFLKNTVTKQP